MSPQGWLRKFTACAHRWAALLALTLLLQQVSAIAPRSIEAPFGALRLVTAILPGTTPLLLRDDQTKPLARREARLANEARICGGLPSCFTSPFGDDGLSATAEIVFVPAVLFPAGDANHGAADDCHDQGFSSRAPPA